MSSNIKSFLDRLKKTKAAAASSKLDELLIQLKDIKASLAQLLLQHQLDQVSKMIEKINTPKATSAPKVAPVGAAKPIAPIAEALDNLEKITTTKKDVNGKRTFLLHRPTLDFEYEKSAADGHSYSTTAPTAWIAEIEAAETQQKEKNPVVSVWVDEGCISKIDGAIANTGAWKGLGENPNATKYTITIKPGKYEIYRELRQ